MMSKKRVTKSSDSTSSIETAVDAVKKAFKRSPASFYVGAGALVVVIALAWTYIGLTTITVEGFDITNVQNNNSEKLIISGELHVNNPSIISVPVRQLTYDVKYKNKLLGHGTVPQTRLGALGISSIPLTQEIRLVESGGLLFDIAIIGSANITVEGTATLDIPFISDKDIHFSDTIDVGPIVVARVKTVIGDMIDDFFLDE